MASPPEDEATPSPRQTPDAAEANEGQFVDVLDAAQAYLQCREQLRQQLQQGWMQLTSARYSMGTSTVSRLRYHDEPTTYVHVSVVDQATDDDAPACSVRLTCEEPEGSGDPLRWFGGMVSPHLRTAQSTFQNALQAIAHASNARSQLAKVLAERSVPQAAQDT